MLWLLQIGALLQGHPQDYHTCTGPRFNLKTVSAGASLAVLQLSIIRILQYDWLSCYWRVMKYAMETRFLNIYSTFYGHL